MSNTIVVSQHQTRLAAYVSKHKWQRRQAAAAQGDATAQRELSNKGIGIEGRLKLERAGRHTHEKWAIFYFPPEQVPGQKQPV